MGDEAPVYDGYGDRLLVAELKFLLDSSHGKVGFACGKYANDGPGR